MAAQHASDPHANIALEELCQAYWPPLYAYLRGRGFNPDRAQDLTQGFFARLLETAGLRRADPERGRFRSFLLTALKRYVINEYERETAVRRGGAARGVPLDIEAAERAYAADLRHGDTPEQVFDRKWAQVTLDRALHRLRDEYADLGRGHIADALLPYLTQADHLPSYRAIAGQLKLTEGAVKVAVHRMRQRYGAVLRSEVSDTLVDAAGVDDELRELLRVVSR